MCIRDRHQIGPTERSLSRLWGECTAAETVPDRRKPPRQACVLYTSDAADERSSVDLGGRRILKKKKKQYIKSQAIVL